MEARTVTNTDTTSELKLLLGDEFAPTTLLDLKKCRQRWGVARNPRTPKRDKGPGPRMHSPSNRSDQRMLRYQLRDWEGHITPKDYLINCEPPASYDQLNYEQVIRLRRLLRRRRAQHGFCGDTFATCRIGEACHASKNCAQAAVNANHIAPALVPAFQRCA